jgi:hypothetical protein
MTRRDAFLGLRDMQSTPGKEEQPLQVSTMLPNQPLDLIPTASFKKKRSR